VKDQLERRLQQLKREFESGQKALVELERQQADLRETLLRISGAVQVLEEELQRAEQLDADPAPDTDGHLAQVTP
jgi:predicted  nucleic acid-binding Zn-ribbon protein